MTTYLTASKLTTIDCGSCGGTYAISESFRQEKHNVGGSWTCPYCRCGWGYSGNSENERLKREVERQKREVQSAENRVANERARHDQTRAELRETEARRRAEKGAKTRIKNRVANGVCPCCNRSFADLHRHMASQHPDFASQDQP